MKKKILILSVIINVVLMGVIYNLFDSNGKISEERKQILKEMTISEKEQELENKINELNNSTTEYATYVQNCKAKIANAITEKGIATSETDTIDVIVENIKKLGSNSPIDLVDFIYVSDSGATTAKYTIYKVAPSSLTSKTIFYETPSYSDALISSVTYSYPNYSFKLKVDCYVNGVEYAAGSVIKLLFYDSKKFMIYAKN